jgi:hypothetical protein
VAVEAAFAFVRFEMFERRRRETTLTKGESAMTNQNIEFQRVWNKAMQAANHNTEFQLIWDEAMQAARAAAEEEYAKIDDPYSASDGSAWITIPATTPFGAWVKWNCLAEPDDFDPDLNESCVADAWLTGITTECACVYVAAAKAAASVLNWHLPAAGITSDGYLDRPQA